MFKKIFNFIIVLLGVVVLFIGYSFYHNKINNMTSEKSTANLQTTQKSSSASYAESSLNKKVISTLAKNLPSSAQDKINNAVKQNRKVILTLLVREESSVEKNFKSILEKKYGADVWQINIITYGEVSSSVILNSKLIDQVVATKPDIIIYESPLLLDNLSISDLESTDSNTQILSEFGKTGAVVFVEPSNPIYKGNVYPTQVSNFKTTVATKFNYIDYWSAYPEQASDDMKKLVIDDGVYRTLNDDGQKIWENYLTKLFVAK